MIKYTYRLKMSIGEREFTITDFTACNAWDKAVKVITDEEKQALFSLELIKCEKL